MKCKRCGTDEDRVHGYCSGCCMDLHNLERDMVNRTTVRIALLEKVAEAARWLSDGAADFDTLRAALAALDKQEDSNDKD